MSEVPSQCPDEDCKTPLVPTGHQTVRGTEIFECPACSMMVSLNEDGTLNLGRPLGRAERDTLKEMCLNYRTEKIASMPWRHRVWHWLFPKWYCNHTIQSETNIESELMKSR